METQRKKKNCLQKLTKTWLCTVQSCLTFCDTMDYSTPDLLVHHQLLELTQTHVHWVGHAIQPSHPLMSPSSPIFNHSEHHGLFKWDISLQQVAKYWSFSFSISPSNEYSGPISFRMDWLDLLAVQGTFKHLFQHHSSKASILWHSAFFMVQLSHPYVTTGKTILLIPLGRWTIVEKLMSLLFNKLSKSLISIISRVHHEKFWTGWSTNWNQDCWEKYQ